MIYMDSYGKTSLRLDPLQIQGQQLLQNLLIGQVTLPYAAKTVASRPFHPLREMTVTSLPFVIRFYFFPPEKISGILRPIVASKHQSWKGTMLWNTEDWVVLGCWSRRYV
jgi:hypothetical protein